MWLSQKVTWKRSNSAVQTVGLLLILLKIAALYDVLGFIWVSLYVEELYTKCRPVQSVCQQIIFQVRSWLDNRKRFDIRWYELHFRHSINMVCTGTVLRYGAKPIKLKLMTIISCSSFKPGMWKQ